MKHTIFYSAAALSLGLYSLGLYGCGATAESESTTQPSPPAAADSHADHDHDDHADNDNGGGLSDMEKMKAALAKLSPEDAASAEKQHMCPVSGEMLGVMGAPLKVDVNGRQVWTCCEDCQEQLLESPEEFLPKL